MKLFAAIVTLSIIATLTVSSEAASAKYTVNIKEDSQIVLGQCPPSELVSFDLITYDSNTPVVTGCAYLDFRHQNNSLIRSFTVEFGSLSLIEPRFCESDHSTGREDVTFYCLAQTPSDWVDPNTGSMYTTLYGRVTNMNGLYDIKCAIYSMFRGQSVLLISNTKSCSELQLLLPFSMYPKDATLLWLNKSRNSLNRDKRSVADEESTIKNNTQSLDLCAIYPSLYCLGGKA